MKKITYLIFTLLLFAFSWHGAAQVYCVPTGSSNNGDEIRNFTLSNLNNDSANSEGENGYNDYSNIVLPALLHAGVAYTASLTSGTGSGSHGAAIWIDLNQNGVFDASEMVTFLPSTITSNTTVTFPSFTLSADTPLEDYKLRVQYHYNKSGDELDPCVTTSVYSETEDYTITVLATPSCLEPTDLIVDNINTNSVDLSWEISNTETEWEVLYGEAGFDPETEGISVEVSDNPEVTISGLDSATLYEAYVRAICDEEDESSLSNLVSFRTACGVISSLPYLEDFDAYGTGSEAFPGCWERVTYTSGSDIWPSIVSAHSTSAPNSLRFQSATDTPTYAISPAFAENINDLRVTFMLRREGTSSGTIDIGVMSDANDTSTFELVQTIDPANAVWLEYTFDLNQVTLSGPNNYIALRHNSSANNWYYWLDDFEVTLTPSCLEPTALTTTTVTGSTVDVEWVAGGSETSWEVSWGTPGYTPGNSDEIDTATATTTDYQITGLDAETIYDVYVQADCGEDDLSVWVGPLTVYTGYCLPTTTGNSSHIDSFTAEGDLGQNISNLNTGEGLDGDGYSDFSDQTVEVSGGGEIEVNVEIDGSNTSGLKIWVDWDNNLIFDETNEELVYETTSYSGSHTVTFTVPTNEAGSYRMRVGTSYTPSDGPASACAHTGQGEFEDYTITVVSESESCSAPENITISNITATTATVSWTASEIAVDGYTVDVYEAGADTDTAVVVFTETVTTDVTTVNATELTHLTSYDVYITSDCGSGQTATSDVVTFTTDDLASVGDFNLVKLTLYPNPVSTDLNISASKVIDEIQVYNILGQRVMTHTPNDSEVTIDVTRLPSATYVLKVSVEGVMSTAKFVKK